MLALVVTLIEGKDELNACPSGDPYVGLTGVYYINLCRQETLQKCRAPAFLVDCFGTYMAISGAVWADAVCVDKLVVFSVLYQPNDRPAMEDIARKMKALKNALHRMQAYYREIKERPHTAEEQSQLKFPEFREFMIIKFTYTKRLWFNVFEATTNEENPRHVIVKFVEQYGTEDHKLCEGLDFAPELLTTNPVPVTSRYFMVVMLFAEGAKTLRCFTFNKPEDREAVKRLYQDILGNLHDKGFCHGDFRNSNILVVPTTDK